MGLGKGLLHVVDSTSEILPLSILSEDPASLFLCVICYHSFGNAIGLDKIIQGVMSLSLAFHGTEVAKSLAICGHLSPTITPYALTCEGQGVRVEGSLKSSFPKVRLRGVDTSFDQMFNVLHTLLCRNV